MRNSHPESRLPVKPKIEIKVEPFNHVVSHAWFDNRDSFCSSLIPFESGFYIYIYTLYILILYIYLLYFVWLCLYRNRNLVFRAEHICVKITSGIREECRRNVCTDVFTYTHTRPRTCTHTHAHACLVDGCE